MFEPIRNAIKNKLDTITEIQEVYDYPTESFGGFPAAVVASTRNEAEFETTIENKRIYVFTIYIWQEIEHQGPRKARRVIEGAVDAIIQAFDKDQDLSDVNLADNLPANETLIISFPVLSEIYTSPDAKYVVGEMEIKVVTSFNVET